MTSLDNGPYHGLDALGEEEAVVEGVDGVVGLHVRLALQEDGSGVQPRVRPEHREAAALVAAHQGPVVTKQTF